MRRDPETFGRPCGGVRRPAPNVADFPHIIYLRADKNPDYVALRREVLVEAIRAYQAFLMKKETLASPPGIIVAWRGGVSSSFARGGLRGVRGLRGGFKGVTGHFWGSGNGDAISLTRRRNSSYVPVSAP